MTNCAVCDMSLDERDAPARTTHEGKTYYFCSEQCEKTFEGNRDRYAKKQQRVDA